MLKSISYCIISFTLLLSVFLTTAQPALAVSQPKPWSGVCVGGAIPGGSDVATLQGFECLIANVFSVIISVIGISGFAMFIIGAFRWMLSGNDSKGVETAKNTMTFAIIGIVVAISGFIILNLIASFTGIGAILHFRIPTTTVQGPFSTPVPGSSPAPGTTGPF